MASIYDIAARAGVSTATVSRVINDSPKVRPETAERVRAAMAELDFTPNVFARGLQLDSVKMLSVLSVDLSDLYFASAIQEIGAYMSEHGYDIQVGVARDNPVDQQNKLKSLLARRPDGIILVGSGFVSEDHSHILAAAERCPIVLLNGLLEGPGIYSVQCDDAEGIRLAVGEMRRIGKKRLVYIGDERNSSARAKITGFLDSSGWAELNRVCIVDSAPLAGLDLGYRAIDSLLAEGEVFDGVVCAEDRFALSAMRRLAEQGLRMPTDVAVTGYDNLGLPILSTPQLTSVDAMVAEMAQNAAKFAVDAIEGRAAQSATLVLTPQLVARATTLG